MAKKSKRKQRRKAKVAATVTPATTKHDEPLDLKMHRLQLGLGVGEDADGDELLEEAIKLAATERKKMAQAVEAQEMCTHGLASDKRIKSFCLEFLVAIEEAQAELTGIGGSATEAFQEAAISTSIKFCDVWSDATKMVAVMRHFIANAAAAFLEGEKGVARRIAVLANFLENIAFGMFLSESPDLSKGGKYDHVELYYGNDRTLVSFLKKRLECSCLDEIYKEVKSMKKMGFCENENCKHHFSLRSGVSESDWELDRSSLMACSRCRCVTYCSVECQKTDWPAHKSRCNEVVKRETVAVERFGL